MHTIFVGVLFLASLALAARWAARACASAEDDGTCHSLFQIASQERPCTSPSGSRRICSAAGTRGRPGIVPAFFGWEDPGAAFTAAPDPGERAWLAQRLSLRHHLIERMLAEEVRKLAERSVEKVIHSIFLKLGLAWDIKRVKLEEIEQGLVSAPNGRLIAPGATAEFWAAGD